MKVKEIMTAVPAVCGPDTPLEDIARTMVGRDCGAIPVVAPGDNGVAGIITDRDIVVRAVAAGRPLDTTKVSEICTEDLVQVDAHASIEEIVAIMREHAIRRVPVVHGDKPIGIVSIGDLARINDPGSALADISSAAPNN
jgi:CBS domain-containing protein